MILSNKPPYTITPIILQLVSSISRKLGEVDANYLNKQSPQLRKGNAIKTIHASLQIEGNTLSEEQITALVDNKKIVGPEKDVIEVLNAIRVYQQLDQYNCFSERSFLKAHKTLMQGLVKHPGKYRQQGVGIVKGSRVEHIAPPHKNVPFLMKELLAYLKNPGELSLIKSCVFHYEMEFIHPFLDGNGRMGRLWQTLILSREFPIFNFIPFETLIRNTQKDYYKALAMSDKNGHSTVFVEYMLNVIDMSLEQLLDYNSRILKDIDRLEYFMSLGYKSFTRKDYMAVFKDISTATASRDLQKGVALKLFRSSGNKNKTVYIL